MNTFDEFENKLISRRQLIQRVKDKEYENTYVLEHTTFLDEYNPTILERIYCVINHIDIIIKCPYCGKKRKWNDHGFKYYDTCCEKECLKKNTSDKGKGKKTIAANQKAEQFKLWQASITEINDELIKQYIKYDKYLDLIDNTIILSYLDNRFNDSADRLETLHRIKLEIEEKPKCPICGNPVTFVGRKAKMFTRYCSNTCAGQSEETKKKKEAAQLANWGTTCCYNSEKYKQKVREQYGVDYISQRSEVIAKKKKTFLEKYGYEYACQNPEVKQRIIETSNANQLNGTSREEEQIYVWLQELGYDVIHHYKSDLYPFNCDFYIKNYDLYIEYQGSFYHNKRAYLNTEEDRQELKEYQEKCKILESEGKNPKIKGLIDTWSIRDVIKRQTAMDNKINFLEIYKCHTKEQLQYQIELWHNCYMNNNIIKYNDMALHNDYKNCLSLSVDEIKANYQVGLTIIKHFQENIFFKTEKEIYANNPIMRRKLIQNRIKYLNKDEENLTTTDIITGFKKSAIHYGYSHFNPEWTNWFITKYDIKSVYDPCGGWGHHLLGMLSCNKIVYNELNPEVVSNIENMKSYFNIRNLEIHNEDGTTFIPENVDAWFMCPPYYNIEIYNGKIYKDLEEYKEFLNKIYNIWKKSNSKIFGIIIREDFIDLINGEYSEKFCLNVQTSHLIKERKKQEYFYIFKK